MQAPTVVALFARGSTRGCLLGHRAYGSAPRNWGDNVSILGALTLRGTWEPMRINGATDGRVFLACLDQFLVPQLWPGAVVVMDNLGAHKVKGVREKIEAAARACSISGPTRQTSTPSRWPGANSKPACAKVAARTTDALDKASGEGWRAVSAKDACGYFAHSRAYTSQKRSRCVRGRI